MPGPGAPITTHTATKGDCFRAEGNNRWSPQDPAEDLISVADEESADFIVIGLRRRSPVGKLILGSNAQRILLDASCPVLAVKAE